MRKEDALIWFLSVPADEPPPLDNITSLAQQGLDWEYIFSRAGLEGVSGLIYHRLKKNQLNCFIPDDVRFRFESVYYTYSAHNAVLYEEFKTVTSALGQEDIPIIVLKGIFLAAHVYENIALRPMRDFDLLVKKEDVLKALDVLARLRYRPIVDARKQLSNPYNYSLTFSKHDRGTDTPVSLDLHWHILNSTWMMGLLAKEFNAERLWLASEPVIVETIQTLALSLPHLVISLATNGFTHCFQRLIMLSDIAQVLKRYKDRINIDSIREEARAGNLENILEFSFDLVEFEPFLSKQKKPPTFGGFNPPRRNPRGLSLGMKVCEGYFLEKEEALAFRPRGSTRQYHPLKACIVYLMTQRGMRNQCRSILRLCLVITQLLFKRLAHKKT